MCLFCETLVISAAVTKRFAWYLILAALITTCEFHVSKMHQNLCTQNDFDMLWNNSCQWRIQEPIWPCNFPDSFGDLANVFSRPIKTANSDNTLINCIWSIKTKNTKSEAKKSQEMCEIGKLLNMISQEIRDQKLSK